MLLYLLDWMSKFGKFGFMLSIVCHPADILSILLVKALNFYMYYVYYSEAKSIHFIKPTTNLFKIFLFHFMAMIQTGKKMKK